MTEDEIRKIVEIEAEERQANAKYISWRIRDAISILAEHGYVIVPKEPTEAMFKAVREACGNRIPKRGDPLWAGEIYTAMIAAAQEPTP